MKSAVRRLIAVALMSVGSVSLADSVAQVSSLACASEVEVQAGIPFQGQSIQGDQPVDKFILGRRGLHQDRQGRGQGGLALDRGVFVVVDQAAQGAVQAR
ncbi:hypothetical protein KHO49_02110 [Pseudomonas sp. RC4D1]|nr:hypothetical protein [Pseudomonas sp. RC4D1]